MLKYVVRVNIDKNKYPDWLKTHKPIKDWDGVAPLYGARKYSLRLTTKLEMAMQYNKEEDAYHYVYNYCTDDMLSSHFPPILNAEVVAIEFEPKEVGVTRVYVPKRQRH